MNFCIFSLTFLASITSLLAPDLPVQHCVKHGYATYSVYPDNSNERSVLSISQNSFISTHTVQVRTTVPTRNRLWTMQFYECYGFIYYTLSNWRYAGTYLAKVRPQNLNPITSDPLLRAVQLLQLERNDDEHPADYNDPRLFQYSFHDYIKGYMRLDDGSFLNHHLRRSNLLPLWSFLPAVQYIGKSVEPFTAQLVECIQHRRLESFQLTQGFVFHFLSEEIGIAKNVTIYPGVSSFELGRHCGRDDRDGLVSATGDRPRRDLSPALHDLCDDLASTLSLPCPCQGTPGCTCPTGMAPTRMAPTRMAPTRMASTPFINLS